MSRIRHKFRRTVRKLHYLLGTEQWLYPRKISGDLILVYHNVLRHSMPHFNVRNCGIGDFERSLSYLKKHFTFVSLEEMWHEKARSPRLALTMDDGLVNNLRHALPVIEDLGIPTTIYVCTSWLRGRQILWPDQLSMIGHRTKSPLDLQGTVYHHHHGNRYLDDKHRKLTDALLGQPAKVIDQFFRDAEIRTDYSAAEDLSHEDMWRVMRPEEVRILAQSPLITIGSHCVTHISLATMSQDEVLAELKESREALRVITQQEVVDLAYPFGIYTPFALDAAEQLGYTRQMAVEYLFIEDDQDPRIRERTGLYNDRSWEEQMHIVHTAYQHATHR